MQRYAARCLKTYTDAFEAARARHEKAYAEFVAMRAQLSVVGFTEVEVHRPWPA